MPYNVTIDNISPLITYQGQWTDTFNFAGDPFSHKYLGDTFHSSETNGAQALFQFNGTAVYIFGAKRSNHGNYTVQVDDEQPRQFSGFAPGGVTDGVYQVPIYARTDLINELHKVVLTNRGEGDKPYVDIDFVTWTSNDESYSTTLRDDEQFDYTPPDAWTNSSVHLVNYYGKPGRLTNRNGASASLTFEGTGIYLYGHTLDTHGAFTVALNDHPPVVMNGSTNGYHFGVLLASIPPTLFARKTYSQPNQYYADGLGPGKHNLTVTHTDTEKKYLNINYVDIVQPLPGSTSKNRTPIIAGVICGAVAALFVAVMVVWYFMQRKKSQFGFGDLINEPKSCIAGPPAGYVPSSGGPGLNHGEPRLDVTHRRAYIHSKSNDSSTYHGTTRPVLPHELHSGPSVIPVSDTHFNVRVPARSPKGCTSVVQITAGRDERSNSALPESRMRVPDRLQDWGTNSTESSDYGTTEMLPPDYRQATQSFMPPRRV